MSTRENATASVVLQSKESATPETKEKCSKWQMHTLIDLRGGVRYRGLAVTINEQKTVTGTLVSSLNPPSPQPLRLILAEAYGILQATQHYIWLLGEHQECRDTSEARNPSATTFS